MPHSVESLTERYGSSYRWCVIAMAMVSTISAVLSATIINVAIPDIMGSFGIDQVQAQWLSAGYLAAMAITMVLVDYAIKAVGQRLVMNCALVAFCAFSLVGGFALNMEMMSVSRLVQGAASGFMQPLSMIAVFQVFPPEKRGMAMGLYGVGAVLAPGVGPYFGGLLVDGLNWRYVFLIGTPLSAAGLVLTFLFMPEPQRKQGRPRFDWMGFALLVTFLVAALTAFADGARDGWHDVSVVVRFWLAGLSIVAFVVWEARASEPILNVRIFLRPAFAGAAIVSLVLGAGLFGSTYLLPIFVQTVQGLTPTLSGALLLPAGLSMLFLTPLTGRLADRLDPGLQVGFGLTLFAISFWLMAHADVRTSVVTLALWIMVSRIGMGFIFPALSAGGVRALPPELLAQGAGSLNLLRQMGGALGVNLLAVLLEVRTQQVSATLAATQTPGRLETARYLDAVRSLASPAGLDRASEEALALSHLGQTLNGQATGAAFAYAFEVGAVVFALSVGGALLMSPLCRRLIWPSTTATNASALSSS
jgi:DHA2 family multidrug resistance protein